MTTGLKTYGRMALLCLAFLAALISCSGASETEETPSSENTTTTTEQADSEQTTSNTEGTEQAKPTLDNNSTTNLSPNPAFDSLLPTLQQMTTVPVMLPASLPPEIKSVGIEEQASEADPYVTKGDRYSIVLLYADSAPDQVVKPYIHYMTAGRLTASPASSPVSDPTNGLGTPQQLEDVTVPDGTVADLERLEPPQGANYGPFTVGTFEEEGYRYTVMIENDSPEGDATRQILSTMVRVKGST